MIKRLSLVLFLMLLVSACAFDAENLMKAPKPPILAERLRELTARLVDDKNEYAAPEAGRNRQALQTTDLDGDGVEEALLFLRSKADRSLSVHAYALDGEDYVQIGLIANEADTIYSVAYSDLTGDGRQEIIIGWRKGSLKVLTVHALEGGEAALLASTDYTEYALFDIDGQGGEKLMVLKVSASQFEGSVDLYRYSDGLLERDSTAPLSAGINEFKRLRNGVLADGGKALFVTCRDEESAYITDIIACRGGKLVNISMVIEHGASVHTLSAMEMYPADVNSDGVTDVPVAQELAHYQEGEADPVYIYRWANYDSLGRERDAFETYHSISGNWYFILPPEWSGKLTARRTDVAAGRRAVVFSCWQPDDPPIDLLILYVVQKSAGRALDPEDKLVVIERADLAILAEIPPGAPRVDGFDMTKDELQKRIFFITTDWLSAG